MFYLSALFGKWIQDGEQEDLLKNESKTTKPPNKQQMNPSKTLDGYAYNRLVNSEEKKKNTTAGLLTNLIINEIRKISVEQYLRINAEQTHWSVVLALCSFKSS